MPSPRRLPAVHPALEIRLVGGPPEPPTEPTGLTPAVICRRPPGGTWQHYVQFGVATHIWMGPCAEISDHDRHE